MHDNLLEYQLNSRELQYYHINFPPSTCQIMTSSVLFLNWHNLLLIHTEYLHKIKCLHSHVGSSSPLVNSNCKLLVDALTCFCMKICIIVISCYLTFRTAVHNTVSKSLYNRKYMHFVKFANVPYTWRLALFSCTDYSGSIEYSSE